MNTKLTAYIEQGNIPVIEPLIAEDVGINLIRGKAMNGLYRFLASDLST